MEELAYVASDVDFAGAYKEGVTLYKNEGSNEIEEVTLKRGKDELKVNKIHVMQDSSLYSKSV